MRNFNKKIIIIIFLFFSLNNFVFAEIVNRFQIEGNNRVSKDSIKMFSNINDVAYPLNQQGCELAYLYQN